MLVAMEIEYAFGSVPCSVRTFEIYSFAHERDYGQSRFLGQQRSQLV